MNIANLFDYIPFRTFTPVNWDTDMSNLERGLNISPWVVYVVGGYLVMFVIWQFFSKTLVESYVYLNLNSLWIRSFLMISTSRCTTFGSNSGRQFIPRTRPTS